MSNNGRWQVDKETTCNMFVERLDKVYVCFVLKRIHTANIYTISRKAGPHTLTHAHIHK